MENLARRSGKNMRELKAFKQLLALGYTDEGDNDEFNQEEEGVIITLGHPNIESIHVLFKYTGEL